jgi:hypothetical protein
MGSGGCCSHALVATFSYWYRIFKQILLTVIFCTTCRNLTRQAAVPYISLAAGAQPSVRTRQLFLSPRARSHLPLFLMLCVHNCSGRRVPIPE